MPRSVLVLVNRSKPDAHQAETPLRKLIERRGRLVDMLDTDASPLPDAAAEADVIMVVGGDGTLLSQTRRCFHLGLPMLGVNFGRVGVLAQFDLDSLERQADRLFDDGGFRTWNVRPLSLQVERKSAIAFDGIALNEGLVTAGPPYRMITLSLSIDGEAGPTVSGDGMIVSTPLGSTAYNVSAGGPIVSPQTEALIITPIAAHSLSFRPIVVAGTQRVELTVCRLNDGGAGGGTTLVLDGQLQHRLVEGDLIRFGLCDRGVPFVVNPEGSYWATLIEKMHWASSPRQRGAG